jgi:hypothetical protein
MTYMTLTSDSDPLNSNIIDYGVPPVDYNMIIRPSTIEIIDYVDDNVESDSGNSIRTLSFDSGLGIIELQTTIEGKSLCSISIWQTLGIIIGNIFLIGQKSVFHLARPVEVPMRSLVTVFKVWAKKWKGRGPFVKGFPLSLPCSLHR